MTTRDGAKPPKGGAERAGRSVALAAVGLEAEFSMVLDGQPAKPEAVFGSPTAIVREPMMHRTGKSYHLPTGGAVYFDTGVIELATPVIEIARGCAARAGRSLWESIRFLREELDAWEAREGHTIHLSGFSTHYNVSFEAPNDDHGGDRTVEKLALLLTHIVPMPVMLLAANRRSTGIGVRPRGNRVEITADFTPDAALMIAAATVIVGVTREVMTWRSFDVDDLTRRGIPVVCNFTPEPHSSRMGWVARYSSFAENPFQCDVNAPIWATREGELRSVRGMASRITREFWPAISRVGDARSLRLINAVMDGRAPSMLEQGDRPVSYDEVGHLCTWANLFPIRALARSRYEQVFIRAIARRPLRIGRQTYTPTGMHGWSHVVFSRDDDRTRHVFSLDYLLRHLDRWAVGPLAEKRIQKTLRERLERRE